MNNRPCRILLLLLCALAPGIPFADTLATLLEVEDGDTLLVAVDGERMRIQLLGIDAPEDVENPKLIRDRERTGLETETLLDLGRRATAFLASQLQGGQQLSLAGDLSEKDKYGRSNLIVRDGGEDSLNARMVASGHAVVLSRYLQDNALKELLEQLEREAVEQQRGLWQDPGSAAFSWSGKAP